MDLVTKVQVGIDLEDGERTTVRERPEDRDRDGVVTAQDDRRGSLAEQAVDRLLGASGVAGPVRDRSRDVARVDDRVGTPPPEVQNGDLTAAAKAAGCDLRLNLKDEGSTHLDPQSDDLPKYGTNPPTSGDHYPTPLADGAFLDYPSPGSYVHSLEHGRIIIEYSPDLSEEDQLALKGVFDADQKRAMIEKLTDTMVDIEGEAMRPVTWVTIEEVDSGDWGIGGKPLTTQDVHDLQAAGAR